MESEDTITEAGRVVLIMKTRQQTRLSFQYLYDLTYAMGRRAMTDTLSDVVRLKLQPAS